MYGKTSTCEAPFIRRNLNTLRMLPRIELPDEMTLFEEVASKRGRRNLQAPHHSFYLNTPTNCKSNLHFKIRTQPTTRTSVYLQTPVDYSFCWKRLSSPKTLLDTDYSAARLRPLPDTYLGLPHVLTGCHTTVEGKLNQKARNSLGKQDSWWLPGSSGYVFTR